jgi:hypothetical protein
MRIPAMTDQQHVQQSDRDAVVTRLDQRKQLGTPAREQLEQLGAARS